MSSNDIAVAVRGLSKSYTITHNAAKHTMMGEALMHRLKNPLQRAEKETFWALKDIEFDIKKGDVVGIIGRNGAGKSTLLKILSQITEPTRGQVRLYGRVGSLLEVGTGFHPELTGRENIYLNGAILGMRRSEIDRQFDAIVDFAEVEQFLDTPVKRYSSGMYVRLAFAVAAHLNPEILIVDEVLAVGDANFQKKCLGKMHDVSQQEGKTVLFVSHNMGAVTRLCQRALLLDRGTLIHDAEANDAVAHYMMLGAEGDTAQVDLTHWHDRSGDGTARVVEACIRDIHGNICSQFAVGDSLEVEFTVEYKTPARFSHSVDISNGDGLPIFHLWDVDSFAEPNPPAKRRKIIARIDNLGLFPDQYFISLWAGSAQGIRADRVANCLSFTVEQSNVDYKRVLHKSKGLIYREIDWTYIDA